MRTQEAGRGNGLAQADTKIFNCEKKSIFFRILYQNIKR